jgi:TRAP-type C4-dicarboxylate transport system permease small subunit
MVTNGVKSVVKWLSVVSSVAFSVMLLIVVVNVGGRFLFNSPVLGTIEIVEMTMVLGVFFALSYTAVHGGHVDVDVFVSHLPKRAQSILERITYLLGAVIIGFMTYRASVNAIYYLQHPNETSTVLMIPQSPTRIVMAVGCLLLTIVLLVQVFSPYRQSKEGVKEV